MKLQDIKPLMESVTFGAVDLLKSEQGEYYSGRYSKVEKECWYCDGTGVDDYNMDGKEETCRRCEGKKVTTENEPEGPELNVANANAYLIAQMLGLEYDDGIGLVKHEDIPAVMKRLMMLKNTDRKDAYVRPTEVSHGSTRVDRSGDVPKIGRGPTMHHMGVDASRIAQYVDKLIEIFKYAQQNGMHVSWS